MAREPASFHPSMQQSFPRWTARRL
jgi:hypothetical protein